MSRRIRITGALVGLVTLVVLGWLFAGPGDAGNSAGVTGTSSVSAVVGVAGATPLSELPAQAAEVWRLIKAGGPFEHEQDGRTFGNRERLLPDRSGGYYREYTVPTPGEDDRGARRLVTGRDGELYYTADHYASFVTVDPDR